MDRDEFTEKLKTKIAGETISWKEYERFNIGALPKTLSTLMKVTKAEARLEATQGFKLSPRMRLTMYTIVVIMIVAFIGFFLFRSLMQ